MASATPDLRLPSQSQDIAAPRLVANYTAWWQRHVCVCEQLAYVSFWAHENIVNRIVSHAWKNSWHQQQNDDRESLLTCKAALVSAVLPLNAASVSSLPVPVTWPSAHSSTSSAQLSSVAWFVFELATDSCRYACNAAQGAVRVGLLQLPVPRNQNLRRYWPTSGPCPVSERLAKQKFSTWGFAVNPN